MLLVIRSVLTWNFWFATRLISVSKVWYPGKLIVILRFPGTTSSALPTPPNSATWPTKRPSRNTAALSRDNRKFDFRSYRRNLHPQVLLHGNWDDLLSSRLNREFLGEILVSSLAHYDLVPSQQSKIFFDPLVLSASLCTARRSRHRRFSPLLWRRLARSLPTHHCRQRKHNPEETKYQAANQQLDLVWMYRGFLLSPAMFDAGYCPVKTRRSLLARLHPSECNLTCCRTESRRPVSHLS